jgi:hypothetical protein
VLRVLRRSFFAKPAPKQRAAETLAENTAMLKVFADAGLPAHRR